MSSTERPPQKYFSLESSAERVSHETREQSREDKGEDGERKRPPPLRARRENSRITVKYSNARLIIKAPYA